MYCCKTHGSTSMGAHKSFFGASPILFCMAKNWGTTYRDNDMATSRLAMGDVQIAARWAPNDLMEQV